MKTFAAAMLLANASAAEVKSAVDIQMVIQITEGVLKGALDAEGFTDIEHCIQDVETFVGDAESAIQDFEKKSASGVIDGLKEVAAMYKVIQSGMSDCTKGKADWGKMIKMISAFDSPTSFAYHIGKDLIVNGRSIFHDVNNAITDYKAKDWYDFGVAIGDASAKTLLGGEEMQMSETVSGMTQAYGLKIDIGALLACIGDEDKALLTADAAVQAAQTAIKDKSIEEAIPAAILMYAAYQTAIQGLPACEAIKGKSWNSQGFMNSMSTLSLESPAENMNTIMINSITNPDLIFEILKNAVMYYEQKDFEKFGLATGILMQQLTLKPETEVLGAVEKSDKTKNAADLIQGMMKGMKIGTFNFTALLECIYEADQDAELVLAVTQLEEEAWKNKDWIPGVMGVAFAYGAVETFVQQVLPICKQVDSVSVNMETFDKITKDLWHYDTRLHVENKEILFNKDNITTDFKSAFEQLESDNYYNFGEQMGSTLAKAAESNQFIF